MVKRLEPADHPVIERLEGGALVFIQSVWGLKAVILQSLGDFETEFSKPSNHWRNLRRVHQIIQSSSDLKADALQYSIVWGPPSILPSSWSIPVSSILPNDILICPISDKSRVISDIICQNKTGIVFDWFLILKLVPNVNLLTFNQ